MTSKASYLINLVIGDIFNARSVNAPYIICIVTNIDNYKIYSRRLTDQSILTFDVESGLEIENIGNNCEIESIEPLPLDIYNSMVGMDRRFRLSSRADKFTLDDKEKLALHYVQRHFSENKMVDY